MTNLSNKVKAMTEVYKNTETQVQQEVVNPNIRKSKEFHKYCVENNIEVLDLQVTAIDINDITGLPRSNYLSNYYSSTVDSVELDNIINNNLNRKS